MFTVRVDNDTVHVYNYIRIAVRYLKLHICTHFVLGRGDSKRILYGLLAIQDEGPKSSDARLNPRVVDFMHEDVYGDEDLIEVPVVQNCTQIRVRV